MAEIRGFSGNFAPMYWAFCNGQTLAISQYSALFALLGTTYGGDGITTFKLPDLQGRVPVGSGQGPGLSYYELGESVGYENIALNTNNLPTHNHPASTALTVSGTATGNITPMCCEEGGDKGSAVGNALASIQNGYVGPSDATGNMAPIAASLTLNGTVGGTVAIGTNGGSQPFPIVQPVLAINWIICIQGIWPPRD